jgi:hypothetical protein
MKLAFIVVFVLGMSAIGTAQHDASASAWKEYVYTENDFAITLPSDPHPHKSSQMPNGTAYSALLSNRSGFSLHTMEANDRCVDAVRSQRQKVDSAGTPDGFKGISIRDVAGPGYTGIEFTQQVPNGKIDYERWICGPHRLYVLASAWNPGEPEPKDLRRIVDSFRVITQK